MSRKWVGHTNNLSIAGQQKTQIELQFFLSLFFVCREVCESSYLGKKASVKSWFGDLFYFSVLIEIADFFVWCSKNASLKQGKIGKNKSIEENIDQNPGKDMKWSNAVMWRILLKKSKRHTWTKRATAYCKGNSAEWRIQAFSKPRWGWSFDKILQI